MTTATETARILPLPTPEARIERLIVYAMRRIAANGLLAASSWALHPRHHYGTDGSDHVSFLSSAAALIARTAGRRTAVSDHVLWTCPAGDATDRARSCLRGHRYDGTSRPIVPAGQR